MNKVVLLGRGLNPIFLVTCGTFTATHLGELLESMPVLLRDTSPSELYVRLSPHTAPSQYLLFLLGISSCTNLSVDWLVLVTKSVQRFHVLRFPIIMVPINMV